MLLGAWPLGGKNSSASSHSGKLKFVILCFGYTLFLVIGAAIFSAIEGPKIELLSQKVRDLRMKFLQKNACVDDDELESFIRDITQANEKGISTLRNASNELNWSFGQAIFFSTTVITTIGYGHVTPLSSAGKLFCMIYATIGIPLTLILLNAAVYRLLRPIEWLLGVLNSKLGHLYQPFNIRFLHLSIIMIGFILIFLTIPTFIFTYLEPSWEFLDAFYYCFISLTTIGLGDYIPGDDLNQDNRSIYKIGTTCYLILGLTAMMLTVTVFYDIPQLNVGQLFTDMDSDETEKLRLSGSGAPCYSGPSGLYIPQRNEEVRSVVRIRPRADDSPSPDDPTPMHARDIRVP